MSENRHEYLLLKWGVPKGWQINNEEHIAILQKYFDLGSSLSCMTQPNTEEHKNSWNIRNCRILDCARLLQSHDRHNQRSNGG